MTARPPSDYRGDDKLLFGIILGVLAFWLFAQTTLNIAPAMAADLNVATSVMNIAVSITALFSGIFIVVIGGLADRLGRVKILHVGLCLQHRRLAPRRRGATGRPRDAAPDAGPHLSGLVGRLHHAGESRTHQNVLGRRRPSTCGQPLVDGILGWFRVRRAVRRPHGRERWLALDLLRVGGGGSPRDADGPRHPGEQGSRSRELYVRHEGCADVHGHDGRAAGAHDPGQSDRLDEPDHPWARPRSLPSVVSCSSGPSPQRDLRS